MPGPIPLNEDLKELIGLLKSHDVEFLIVGAHALARYGRPRFTEDLDLYLRRTTDNARKLGQALRVFGIEMTSDAEAELGSDPRAMIVLGRKPAQVDFLNFLDGVDFDGAWSRREPGQLAGITVDFISLEDYIASKKASNRPKDLADLALLEEANGRQEE